MREHNDSTMAASAAPEAPGVLVSIFVPDDHPLLQLMRALDWAAITQVCVKYWREAGKNVDGGPGRPWPVSLYVPLLVLMRVQHLHDRAMERYLAYDAAARVFIGWTKESTPWVRDHSNIARAVGALGVAGWRQIDELIVTQAVELGFGDPRVLSSDTTVQEPQIGYPNEPGILRGVAQRVYRALKKMGRRGVEGGAAGIEKAKEIFRLVKHHHLFAKGADEKQEVLKQLVEKTKQLMGECGQVVERVGKATQLVVRSGLEKLKQMEAFCAILLPQILHWLQTGAVAQGKLLHAGVSEARAIAREQSRQTSRVRFQVDHSSNWRRLHFRSASRGAGRRKQDADRGGQGLQGSFRFGSEAGDERLRSRRLRPQRRSRNCTSWESRRSGSCRREKPNGQLPRPTKKRS